MYVVDGGMGGGLVELMYRSGCFFFSENWFPFFSPKSGSLWGYIIGMNLLYDWRR